MTRTIFLATTTLMLLAGAARADTRDDVMNAIQRCSIIRDDRTWLDCTYGAQQIMRAKLGLPPAPDFQQRLVPPSPNYPRTALPPSPAMTSAVPNVAMASAAPPASASDTMQRRGSVMQELGGTAPPVTISTLADIQFSANGMFTVTLANGQVWREVDETKAKANFRLGAKITIRPSALWSYSLKAEGTPHVYKVERKA